MSKPARSSVTAKVFCARLSKNYNHLPFPNFSETGKEWDSKAKAYLRPRIKAVFNAKEIDLTNVMARVLSHGACSTKPFSTHGRGLLSPLSEHQEKNLC